MAIDPQLLEILRCPSCLSEVKPDGDGLLCVNAECRRRYAIEEDIPIMLIDKATVLEPQAWQERIDSLNASS